ncbi:MAG: aldehyde dehydrogenase (NADP(+)) [Balneolaceae bacterium]|nr:MAG: aldehyde dehydrogenase (NADP(+)) [Balneolaceae bacterium]
MTLTGLNFIGLDHSGQGSETFQAVNPADQSLLETHFKSATPDEVERAVSKADEAFLPYRMKSNEERASFLEAIADEILNFGDELIQRCMLETALPEARLTGERGRTVNQLKLFADVVREGSWVDARIDTAIPGRQPVPKPDLRYMQIPLGPAGIFGASNFPLAFSVAGGDTASALAAGCPVVVKAHPLHPGTSEIVAKAILKAAVKSNMPDGVFSLLQGVSNQVGMDVVKHPKITAIGFTGSFKGGKAIFDAANQREIPIPVFAEMGSSNPVFILPGALKEWGEKIASGITNSVTLGVGQFCTSPGLIITKKSDEADAFLNNLQNNIAAIPAGTMLSGRIKDDYITGLQKLETIPGIEKTADGRLSEKDNQVSACVYTTDYKTFQSHDKLDEEIFGPSTLLVNVSGKEEMLTIAGKLQGHLTATIHGSEQEFAAYEELIRILERKVGRLIFNGYPTGVEVCSSMMHGGPYPASTSSQSTSVGTAAIYRFSRPVCYQDFPDAMLPNELKEGNPLGIQRMVNQHVKQA